MHTQDGIVRYADSRKAGQVLENPSIALTIPQHTNGKLIAGFASISFDLSGAFGPIEA